jgi:hypothetical protein
MAVGLPDTTPCLKKQEEILTSARPAELSITTDISQNDYRKPVMAAHSP